MGRHSRLCWQPLCRQALARQGLAVRDSASSAPVVRQDTVAQDSVAIPDAHGAPAVPSGRRPRIERLSPSEVAGGEWSQRGALLAVEVGPALSASVFGSLLVLPQPYEHIASERGRVLSAQGRANRGDEDDDEARAEESDDGAEKPALYLYDDSSDAHESYSDDTGDSDDTNDVDDAHLPGSLDDKWRIGSWAGTATLPLAAGLRPDWAFLCAVRVVVEANMREAVGARELGGLLALDALRTGSAPLDARSDGDAAWFAGAAKAGAGFADGMWDWAGVTGVWRPVFVSSRCVCWLDYKDLIRLNVRAPSFLRSLRDSDADARTQIASDKAHVSESTLREAVRIVPLRLRVIAHGAPAVPAWPGRPTLYVEGETSGSSQNGAIRRVRGTVSALADGSARWSLGLLGADDGHEQWMSEGVQLGGPSSSMGVLGLWTGSQHERTDPVDIYRLKDWVMLGVYINLHSRHIRGTARVTDDGNIDDAYFYDNEIGVQTFPARLTFFDSIANRY
ncbi:predicted protein [Postia placenta Mad-698-R]|nr:predicted protein [Postia placenta Mad-698-R]